jgi:exosortase A-associated hydrolase 2
MSGEHLTLLPRFMGDEGEKYFTMQFSCSSPKAHIVFIPGFCEEMNRCRSLVATQARSFAASGYACTLVDFYGTGDSQGQLGDATLSIWYDNISRTIDTLKSEQDLPVILWGMRLGGLLVLDYAARNPGTIRDIILWQPVNGARVYITQMLRQRVASLMVRDLPPETTREIRQRLEEGEEVEIAGYLIRGPLVRDIEAIDLAAMMDVCTGTIHWLEHVTEAGKGIGVASQKAVDQLAGNGASVDVLTFSDPPLWLIHERDFAPELLAATDSLLS